METEEEKLAREAEEAKQAEELKKKEEDELNSHQSDNDLKDKADKLLDGTLRDKKITIKKERFDDRNEKAKLYETYAPLLDKVLENPEMVEELLETREKGDLETRLERIEEERRQEKRTEIRQAVMEAIKVWPDFETSWADIQPITDSLFKQGLNYKEAVRRGYLAIHPEAANAETERMAREGLNREGAFSVGGSMSPKLDKFKSETKLSEDEKKVARALGKSEEEYSKLLEKHKDWISSNLGL